MSLPPAPWRSGSLRATSWRCRALRWRWCCCCRGRTRRRRCSSRAPPRPSREGWTPPGSGGWCGQRRRQKEDLDEKKHEHFGTLEWITPRRQLAQQKKLLLTFLNPVFWLNFDRKKPDVQYHFKTLMEREKKASLSHMQERPALRWWNLGRERER